MKVYVVFAFICCPNFNHQCVPWSLDNKLSLLQSEKPPKTRDHEIVIDHFYLPCVYQYELEIFSHGEIF